MARCCAARRAGRAHLTRTRAPAGPLCALAEICGDNPADAGATHVSIDVLPAVCRDQFDTGPRLRIVDDGCSMSAQMLYHAVSYGFTTRKKGRYGMVRVRARARAHALAAFAPALRSPGARLGPRWRVP